MGQRTVGISEVVLVLESDFSPIGGLDAPLPPDAPIEADILREVWRQVETAIGQVLQSITLDDLY